MVEVEPGLMISSLYSFSISFHSIGKVLPERFRMLLIPVISGRRNTLAANIFYSSRPPDFLPHFPAFPVFLPFRIQGPEGKPARNQGKKKQDFSFPNVE